MREAINLYRNTKKTTRLLVSSIGVFMLLAVVLLYSIGLFDGVLRTKSIVFSGAVMLIMFFLILKSVIGLRDKSALISLTSDQFVGKTTPLSKAFGYGEWMDVRDIQLQKVGGDTLVVVSVANVEKYRGRLSKMLWNMAYDESNQLLHLGYSSSEIYLNANALFDLFVQYWLESQKRTGA